MTPRAIVKSDRTQVVRSLKELVPLIQEDLKHAREAADRAAEPYWMAAGQKLNEAKAQLKYGEFTPWVQRHFQLPMRTATRFMAMAAKAVEIGHVRPILNQSVFIREHLNPEYNKPSSWHEPVKEIIDRVDTETLNLKRAELERAEEREAQRILALRLIDIGYKVLAIRLHPDKGGSREAMSRLNEVRKRLKGCA